MNIIASNNNLTMSSEELSALLNLRHDNVRQAAKNLQSNGVITFTESSVKGNGRPKIIMHFDRRNSIVISAKLNDKFMGAVVDRWIELENKQSPQIPTNFAEALQLAADQARQLEHKAKKVEQLESLFHNGGTIAQFVKQLNGVNSQKVNSWLYDSTKWLYDENKGKVYLTGRKQGQLKPHAWRCAAYSRDKYLTETNYNLERQGLESMVKYEVQLLADGKKWLFDKYVKGNLPMKTDWNGEFTHKKDLI